MTIFGGINVVSISVPDLAAATDFYSDTLGLGAPLYDLPEAGWVELATGGPGNLALVPAIEGWHPTDHVTVVLNTDDCHASVERLRTAGVDCDDPEVFPGFVTFASFRDPWGNRLQMCSDAPEVSPGS